MKHYNINSKTNYTNVQVNEKIFTGSVQIWLITTNGEVLVKKDRNIKNEVEIANLTIQASNIAEAVREIDTKWGILCSAEDLEKIYSFKSESSHRKSEIQGFVLQMNIDLKHYCLIKERGFGEFIDYVYLEDLIKGHKQGHDFKEAFVRFLEFMSNKA